MYHFEVPKLTVNINMTGNFNGNRMTILAGGLKPSSMGFRFWRRVKIAPGVTINLSKSGASVSLGPRGAKFTVGPRGSRVTAGIPGTGLFYTHQISSGKTGRKAQKPRVAARDRLDMGFFKRLITPDDQEALVDACRELTLGNEAKARGFLNQATHLADGAFLAGFLSLKQGDWSAAEDQLTQAAGKRKWLGHHFEKYGITTLMSLAVTDELTVHTGPDIRAVWLGLTEIYQQKDDITGAKECLEKLRAEDPDNPVARLSLAELLWEENPKDKKICQKIIRLIPETENETPLDAALLLYKARALRGLDLSVAARDCLTTALRRKKDRPEELLLALRYDRAGVYEALGRKSQARKDLQRIFAVRPGYENVATRLGL